MLASRTKKTEKVIAASNVEKTIEKELPPILIIHGAASTKVGFGGEKFPRFVFPRQSSILSDRIKRFPLEGSYPTNEEWVKAYWQAMIMKLGVDLSERKVVLSLPTANLTKCPFREFAQEFFYEELQAHKIAVISDPFLAMIGYIKNLDSLTGLVVDIGFSQIRIVPIYQASILENYIAQISFGGFELTKTLGSWLENKGYDGPIDAMFLRDIKENLCFVRPFKQEVNAKKEEPVNYTIDKNHFELGSEIWKLPELFFFKDFFSKRVEFCPRSEFDGEKYNLKELTLTKAIGFVIKSLPERLRESMTNNICLVGGGTKFSGFYDRIIEELNYLFPEFKNPRLLASINNDLMAFLGASKISNLPSFQHYWRTIEDYDLGTYDLFL